MHSELKKQRSERLGNLPKFPYVVNCTLRRQTCLIPKLNYLQIYTKVTELRCSVVCD